MNALFLLKSKTMVTTCFDDNTIRRGLEKMHESGYTAIPVINREGDYIGSVNEGDFLWYILEHQEADPDWENHTVGEVLRPGWNPAVSITVTMDELLSQAINQNFIPVVDDRSKFIGIITRKDIILNFAEQNED